MKLDFVYLVNILWIPGEKCGEKNKKNEYAAFVRKNVQYMSIRSC